MCYNIYYSVADKLLEFKFPSLPEVYAYNILHYTTDIYDFCIVVFIISVNCFVVEVFIQTI